MDVERLAADLTAGLEPPVSRVCQDLIREFSMRPTDQQRRMSFAWLAKLVDRSWDDPLFQSAVTALTTVPHHPLVMYFVMHDEVEDREIPLSLQYVKRCLAEGEFVHPRTGEEIPDASKRLVPVFCLSSSFGKLMSGKYA